MRETKIFENMSFEEKEKLEQLLENYKETLAKIVAKQVENNIRVGERNLRNLINKRVRVTSSSIAKETIDTEPITSITLYSGPLIRLTWQGVQNFTEHSYIVCLDTDEIEILD